MSQSNTTDQRQFGPFTRSRVSVMHGFKALWATAYNFTLVLPFTKTRASFQVQLLFFDEP